MHDDTSERPVSFRVKPSRSHTSGIHPSSLAQTPPTEKLPQLLVEVFPISPGIIPRLFAYHLEVRGGERAEMGGRLACRWNDSLPGYWLWTEQRLVTDMPDAAEQVQHLLSTLWRTLPEIFGCVLAIREDTAFQVTAQVQADFVARCLCTTTKIQQGIRRHLREHDVQVSPQLIVRRVCTPRGWVVDGHPALSLSITSEIVANEDLRTYARTLDNPHQQLIGLPVVDRNRKCKGEIVGVFPEPAAFHRERLLSLTQNVVTCSILTQAADDELVVQMRPGKAHANNPNKQPLQYVASALHVLARVEDSAQFGASTQKLLGTLRLSPEVRSTMLKPISTTLQKAGLIKNAFNSKQQSTLFLRSADYGFAPRVLIGENHIVEEENQVLGQLRRHGFYQRNPAFSEETPIRVGVLSGVPEQHLHVRAFWKNLQKECLAFTLPLQLTGYSPMEPFTRATLEQAVAQITTKQPHIILTILPERAREPSELSREEGYLHVKQVTIGRGIPNQVVYAPTLLKTDAVSNIALSLLSKVGNVPFRLAEPLPYTDVIVGIDIARSIKTKLTGSMNALATAQIYQNSEPALTYRVRDARIEGETIPDAVLQEIFSYASFAGKRVLVHRDGWFRGNERAALAAWGQQIGATFFLVEIVKTGAPRFYHWVPQDASQQRKGENQRQMFQPTKGAAFRLSDQEALLVSSLPPSGNVTPSPLHIRAEAPLSIEDALHSVLTLTLLHYGSVRAPRLPITTQYSDKMASLALRGIRPPITEGELPYWL